MWNGYVFLGLFTDPVPGLLEAFRTPFGRVPAIPSFGPSPPPFPLTLLHRKTLWENLIFLVFEFELHSHFSTIPTQYSPPMTSFVKCARVPRVQCPPCQLDYERVTGNSLVVKNRPNVLNLFELLLSIIFIVIDVTRNFIQKLYHWKVFLLTEEIFTSKDRQLWKCEIF